LIENRTRLKASAHPKDSIYRPEEQKIWADVEADFFKKGENVQLYNGQGNWSERGKALSGRLVRLKHPKLWTYYSVNKIANRSCEKSCNKNAVAKTKRLRIGVGPQDLIDNK